MSRWLEREGLRPSELTPGQVERFVAARRAAGYSTWLSVRSTALPLGYLRELGVVSAATAPVIADDPLERLLADYGRYLFDERVPTEHTVLVRYVPDARLFLETTAGAEGLGRVSACRCERVPGAGVPGALGREGDGSGGRGPLAVALA